VFPWLFSFQDFVGSDIGSKGQVAVLQHCGDPFGGLDGGGVARVGVFLLRQPRNQPEGKADHQPLQGAVGAAQFQTDLPALPVALAPQVEVFVQQSGEVCAVSERATR